MGLDAFSNNPDDDDEQQDDVKDEPEEETTAEEEDEEEEQKETGLNAFMSDTSSDGQSKAAEERGIPEPLSDKISKEKWNSMDAVERVKYVRENFIPDYRPGIHTDNRWSWKNVIEVTCVCKNVFTFDTQGICLGCGREYKAHGSLSRRVIELVHEQENDTETNANRNN